MLVGAVALLVVTGLAACSGGGEGPVQAPGKPGGAPVGPTVPPGGVQAANQLTGAGATFPYPIYSKWFDVYEKQTGVKINYQSIGSGGGIRQLIEGTVDFGASDAIMTQEEEQSAGGNILHIPTVIGGVVVVYNLNGVDSGLKLTSDVLGNIFLGNITKWDDPKIKEINPDINLPSTDIAVVHRSDGSGTTNIFTDYLAEMTPEWKDKVGAGKSVKWPVGLGAKGNEGVSGQVKQVSGSIGYVELAYAVQNNLTHAVLKNKAGNYVEPTIDAITEAAAGVPIQGNDLRIRLVNAPGEKAYPIASFTWILVRKEQTDPNKGKALVDFLWWAIHDGEQYAKDLLYAPLPQEVVKKNEAIIKEITYQGTPLYP